MPVLTGNTEPVPMGHSSTPPQETGEVVIVGAGPYGLSAAAYLRDAGIKPYVIGKPMAFWKQNMPARMLLRSRIEASNIAAPQKLSLDAYRKTIGRRLSEPLPIEDFVAYGEWFQKQVAPAVDERQVRSISHDSNHFTLTLEDGHTLHTAQLILATGIGNFAQCPEEFRDVPRDLASHSSEIRDLSKYRGKRVAVIGNGQSALEYAALLTENGANVLIVARAPEIKFRAFAWRKDWFRKLTGGPLRSLSYKIMPPTDLGDIRTVRKMAHPDLFRRQPPNVQEKLIKDCTRPIGAYWLAPRLKDVRAKTSVNIQSVDVSPAGLNLHLSDGTTAEVDVAVLATGYKVDVSKYQILDEKLRDRIEKTPDGYPVLSINLETSIPGLFMAGVVAEKALGPTLRFVTGTSNAGPRLAAKIVSRIVQKNQ